MQCRFVDRTRELAALSEAFTKRPGFVVLYGRRRIGKTRLVREWLRGLGARYVYFVAQLSSHEHNLLELGSLAAEQLGEPSLRDLRPRRLDSLLRLVARIGADVIVIDEFTYWVRVAPRVLSELQYFIDHDLPGTRSLLVVSGSLVGVMERSVLGGGSPLYGRASARLRLGPLSYRYLREFVPRLSPSDRVRLYALVGGIPFYLCLARGATSLEQVVRELILSPAAPLLYEKDFILREELRDPHTYNAVLAAIARGYATPSKIAEVTGLDPSHAHKYLRVLEYLGIVERRAPLFKKKGRYWISDPVIRTWFVLIEPVLELIELGETGEAEKRILEKIDTYTAPVWEELIRGYLLTKYAAMGYNVAGFLEHKGEEVDIAILDTEEKKAIVAEAKWSTLSLREAERLREETRRKAERLLPRDYRVEQVYVAAREMHGEKPSWAITPIDLEKEQSGRS